MRNGKHRAIEKRDENSSARVFDENSNSSRAEQQITTAAAQQTNLWESVHTWMLLPFTTRTWRSGWLEWARKSHSEVERVCEHGRKIHREQSRCIRYPVLYVCERRIILWFHCSVAPRFFLWRQRRLKIFVSLSLRRRFVSTINFASFLVAAARAFVFHSVISSFSFLFFQFKTFFFLLFWCWYRFISQLRSCWMGNFISRFRRFSFKEEWKK